MYQKILVIFFSLFLCSENIFERFDKKNDGAEGAVVQDVFDTLDSGSIIYTNKAKIIVMNKITANSKEFLINVGSHINYGRAEISVHKCGKMKNNKNDNFILVSLKEKIGEEYYKNLFRGWIFSKSLSISAIEHPIYQLIAVSCL